MTQTTIQDISTIRKGSVRVLVGPDFSSLVDIGALRDVGSESMAEKQSIEFDNVDPLKKFVNGRKFHATFTLAEINFDNLKALDPAFINIQTTPATIVNNATQLVVSGKWNYDQFIEIEHQNGNGSALNIDSVVGATTGALVADDDFHVIEVNGKYGIVIHDTGSPEIPLNQNVTITYDYTPNAGKSMSFNDSGNAELVCMRLINVNEDNKEFRIDVENGVNMIPLAIDYAGDNEDDVATMQIDFQGDLVEFYDEQQVSA